MAEVNYIAELKAENERLKAELAKAREKERDTEESGRAMLFMLEDVERSRGVIERSKMEWEATFDAVTDPIFIHDKDFRVIRANMAYRDAAGMKKFKDFIGRPYYEVFPKMEGPFKMCLKAMESHNREEEEIELPHTGRIFKARFYPVNKEFLYSVHVMEDITEAKKAEKRLKDEIDVTTHLLMISEASARTSDVDKLMEQVVNRCREILGCDACLSYLWDKDEKVFKPVKEKGLANKLVPLFRTEPVRKELFRKVFAESRPAILTMPAAAEFIPWHGEMDIGALAAIPLIGRKEPLGLILGVYTNPTLTLHPLPEGEGKRREFTERDMKVIEGIMHQVSIAIEEAKHYRDSIERAMDLSGKIETIQTMHEIDRAILSTLDRDEILETAIRMISRVIPCDKASVALVDKERGGFVTVAGFGIEFLPKGSFVPFTDTTAVEMIKTGRTQYIANLEEMEEPLQEERLLLDQGLLSLLTVPLMVKGEVIGGLSIGSKRHSVFTPDNLSSGEKLAAQIGIALENARLLKDLEELFLGTVKSLSSAIDAKSPWTAGHSERVTKYALQIGKEMGLSEKELKDLELAGLLHDVGKIGTYEAILDKPARPSDEEIVMIKQHPVKGAEILEPIKQLKGIIPAVRHHHEFYDGAGYPEGLKGKEIPLFARIIGVADTIDAMGADRPYRNGKPMDAIVAELKRCAGTQFDPKVVEAFLKVMGEVELGMAAN